MKRIECENYGLAAATQSMLRWKERKSHDSKADLFLLIWTINELTKFAQLISFQNSKGLMKEKYL